MRSCIVKGNPAKDIIMRFALNRKTLSSEGPAQTINVAEPKDREALTKKSVPLEPANIILLTAIIMAIIFLALMQQEISDLRSRNSALSGTLAGTPDAQPGDIVPSFHSVNLESQTVAINFDGASKRLLYIFSPDCSSCVSQFPTWNRLAEVARSRNLLVHAISINGLEESRARLSHIDRNFEILIMPNQPVMRSFRVVSIPEVLVVSAKGMIEWVHYGVMTEEKIKELVTIIEKIPPVSSK